MSSLQAARGKYIPSLPSILREMTRLYGVHQHAGSTQVPGLKERFPKTFGQPIVSAEMGSLRVFTPLSIGIVFSGGPAPGGHNVVSGLFDALERLNPKSRLVGFLNGPVGILNGKYKEISSELLKGYRNQGGFDLMGSGRSKIETEDQLKQALNTVEQLKLDGLVIVGGDDSHTNAAILAEYFLAKGSRTQVIGVPKTIDGDLKSAHSPISFGFDTACKTYAEMIGNIARDALSSGKYYHFIKLMGRSASHIALECALKTQPNLTLLGEEVSLNKTSLQEITTEIADLICERADVGKEFGIILVPEGLIEFIPEMKVLIAELSKILSVEDVDASTAIGQLSLPSQECFNQLPEVIKKQLLFNRDPHGNVQVSFIETEKLLIDMVAVALKQREKNGSYKGRFHPVSHFLGYEGRSAFPSNFDCNYCYCLGYTAAFLLHEGVTGYMSCVRNPQDPVANWAVGGVPITLLMDFEQRKGKLKPVVQKALVDLTGKSFSHFKKMREEWKREDQYLFPGPIQFAGDPSLTESIPFELTL